MDRSEEARNAVAGLSDIKGKLEQKMAFAAQATLDRMLDGLRKAGVLE